MHDNDMAGADNTNTITTTIPLTFDASLHKGALQTVITVL